MQLCISNPWPRQSRYSTERTIFTTYNETVGGHNHSILAKLSGVTHTFDLRLMTQCETVGNWQIDRSG